MTNISHLRPGQPSKVSLTGRHSLLSPALRPLGQDLGSTQLETEGIQERGVYVIYANRVSGRCCLGLGSRRPRPSLAWRPWTTRSGSRASPGATRPKRS